MVYILLWVTLGVELGVADPCCKKNEIVDKDKFICVPVNGNHNKSRNKENDGASSSKILECERKIIVSDEKILVNASYGMTPS